MKNSIKQDLRGCAGCAAMLLAFFALLILYNILTDDWIKYYPSKISINTYDFYGIKLGGDFEREISKIDGNLLENNGSNAKFYIKHFVPYFDAIVTIGSRGGRIYKLDVEFQNKSKRMPDLSPYPDIRKWVYDNEPNSYNTLGHHISNSNVSVETDFPNPNCGCHIYHNTLRELHHNQKGFYKMVTLKQYIKLKRQP